MRSQPTTSTPKSIGRPPGPRVSRTCPQCGRVDEVIPTKLRNPYCSKSCSNASRALPVPERFARYVGAEDAARCWPWIGTRDKDGYGLFTLMNPQRQMVAHRVAWFLAAGEWPLDGDRVIHTCDNPSCVRNDDGLETYTVGGITYPRYGHLVLASADANNKDKSEKGRAPHGEDAPKAKLTEDDVRTIRRLKAEGVPAYELARQFGVIPQNIYHIVAHRSWRHVE